MKTMKKQQWKSFFEGILPGSQPIAGYLNKFSAEIACYAWDLNLFTLSIRISAAEFYVHVNSTDIIYLTQSSY